MSQHNLRIRVLNYLESNTDAPTEELAGKLYVSRSTLRRVLIQLEEEGLVKRYYGGVRLVQSTSLELPVESRLKTNIKDKILVANKAVNLVNDNAVIFLDSSSTIYHFGLQLIKKFTHLKIITNGLEIALALKDYPDSEVYLCPGKLRHNSSSIVGSFCEEFLQSFHADYAFISCKSVDKNGLYEGDVSQAHAKLRMIQQADKSYLLCDQSKFFTKGYYRTADLSSIDGIVCNGELPEDLSEIMKRKNCTIFW